MPDPTPDALTLQGLALRYAAGDLPPVEAAAFEARLAADQDAREALAEAVRLSAAALGQAPPAPDRSFRALIRERLRPLSRWPGWLARRAYRGHPATWAGLGAGVVAATTLVGLQLAGPNAEPPVPPAPAPDTTTADSPAMPAPHGPGPAVGPLPRALTGNAAGTTVGDAAPEAGPGPEDRARTAAEIWADLSTPDHVEKTHEDETRWRQRLRDLQLVHPGRPAPGLAETPEP